MISTRTRLARSATFNFLHPLSVSVWLTYLYHGHANAKEDAAAIGFDDTEFFRQMLLPPGERLIPAQEICITAEMVNDTEWSKSQLPKDMDCPVMTQRVEGGAIIAHSVCKVNGHTLTGDTRTFGDFRDSYTVETTSSVDPAPPGMPNPTKMTIKAERVGDC